MWQRHPFRSADDVARRKRETFSWKKVTIGRAIATGWKQLVERITGFIPPPTESLPSVYDENSTIFPRLISPTEITCCCCRLSPFYRLLSCSSSSKALYKEEGTTAPSSGQTWLAKNQSQTRGRARGERGERETCPLLLIDDFLRDIKEGNVETGDNDGRGSPTKSIRYVYKSIIIRKAKGRKEECLMPSQPARSTPHL